MSARRLALLAPLLIGGYVVVLWVALTIPKFPDSLYLVLFVGCLLGAFWGAARHHEGRHRKRGRRYWWE